MQWQKILNVQNHQFFFRFLQNFFLAETKQNLDRILFKKNCVQKIKVPTNFYWVKNHWLFLEHRTTVRVFSSDKKCRANIFGFWSPDGNLLEKLQNFREDHKNKNFNFSRPVIKFLQGPLPTVSFYSSFSKGPWQ